MSEWAPIKNRLTSFLMCQCTTVSCPYSMCSILKDLLLHVTVSDCCNQPGRDLFMN